MPKASWLALNEERQKAEPYLLIRGNACAGSMRQGLIQKVPQVETWRLFIHLVMPLLNPFQMFPHSAKPWTF